MSSLFGRLFKSSAHKHSPAKKAVVIANFSSC